MTAGHHFYVQNFGCRATQADGAGIAAALAAKGLRQAATPSAAELVIVNTCTVTSEADQDARQTIRRIHRENPQARILVTGCYAQRRPAELARLPGVRWVVGNSHKTAIADVVAPSWSIFRPGRSRPSRPTTGKSLPLASSLATSPTKPSSSPTPSRLPGKTAPDPTSRFKTAATTAALSASFPPFEATAEAPAPSK